MICKFAKMSAALIVASLAVGCGGAAEVSGSVTYNGIPVKSGSVIVRTADGTVFSGNIDNGNYVVSGVPSGAVTFAVASPDPATVAQPSDPATGDSPGRGPPVAPKPGTPAKKPTEGWFAIPPKFADPGNSGLATTLKPGPNTFPLTLTDS